MRLISCLFIFLFILFYQDTSFSKITEKEAVKCIMGEAAGEPYLGKLAVAEVLRRRGSTNGFMGCDNWVYMDPKAVFESKRAWRESKYSNISEGSTHFDSTDFPVPWWAPHLRKKCKIGKHIFYG